ncbi:hypothetical protein [Pseudolysinimonas sp.]
MAAIVADTGPLLSFGCSGEFQTFLDVFTNIDIVVPSTVMLELRGKAREHRFRGGDGAVGRYVPGRIDVREHDLADTEFNTVLERVAAMPLAERLTNRKNLGEVYVIAHALQLMNSGVNVRAVMDDGDAVELARRNGVGVISTAQVLLTARSRGVVTSSQAKAKYNKLRRFDDGLVPYADSILAR